MEFENWLKENLVLTKNLIPHNLVLKNEANGVRIKIVDGLGVMLLFLYHKTQNFLPKFM